MAMGVIDRHSRLGQPVTQILVVTSGWSVMCFDHNLNELWETNLQEDFPHTTHHREIAISISNYTLKHGDSGLVIIGGEWKCSHIFVFSPSMVNIKKFPNGFNHMIFMDPFEEIGVAEKSVEQHRSSATEKEASENSGTVDLRHFAIYVFAG